MKKRYREEQIIKAIKGHEVGLMFLLTSCSSNVPAGDFMVSRVEPFSLHGQGIHQAYSL